MGLEPTTRVLESSIISSSHFSPLCRAYAQRSDANHAETATRPNDEIDVKTVVIVHVTVLCPDAYANRTRPMENEATDITRKTNGDRFIQMRTHQGTRCPGERLQEHRHQQQHSLAPYGQDTHYIACFQVSPSREFTAEAMLKTRLANQNAFTALASAECVSSKENCIVVAVTAEKKVATVDKFCKLAAPCFCPNRIVGTPMTKHFRQFSNLSLDIRKSDVNNTYRLR
jgi:hypothetical protein